jgi:hypothetical protein
MDAQSSSYPEIESNVVVFIIGIRYYKSLVVSVDLLNVLTIDKLIEIREPRFLN